MPRAKATKAFIVGRTSKEIPELKQHRYSVKSQMTSVERYAVENGFEVVDTFPIKNESAFKGKRKLFVKMFNKAKVTQENIQEPLAVIFTEVDRFSRDILFPEVFDLIKLSRDIGLFELHFSEDDDALHKDSPPRRWTEIMNAVNRAWEDSKIKGRRIKRVIEDKVESGQYPGYVPIGFLNVTVTEEIDGELVTVKKIIQDPVRAPLIKEAFELYATGNYSIEELTGIMVGKGLMKKTKKGRKPTPITTGDLTWILNNSFYTGESKWGDSEVTKWTNYEPIISKDMFNKVKKILNERSVKYSTRHSTAKFFKFRGLLRCAFCGCVLTPTDMSSNYKDKNPGEAVYYRCTYRKNSVDALWYKKKFGENHSGVSVRKGKKHYNCPQEFWKEEEIEFLIRDFLETLSYEKEVYKNIRTKIEQEWEEKITVNNAYKKGLENEMTQQEKLKKGLLRQIALADEFEEDFRNELNDVKRQIEQTRQKLQEANELEEADTEQVTELLDLCRDLHKQYDGLNDMDKRRLVMVAFKNIELKRGRIGKKVFSGAHFDYTEPFQELFEGWLKKHIQKTSKGKASGGNNPSADSLIKSQETI